MNFNNLEEALNYAISKENQTMNLYHMFQGMVRDPSAKKLLGDLAAQELGHREILEKALGRGDLRSLGGARDTVQIDFEDYLVETRITEDSDPQEVMRFALKNEKHAFELYQGLAGNYSGTALQAIFKRLADEELKHKQILQEQYEEHFMQWM